ncbi:MAG: glycosyltransferase family 2 protein [Proteobacteria bacterium]|nr:glycosyltransferase family 2 protein [Pseudomonadota bacterium]
MVENSQPSICIIIAAYNASATIARAVHSALAEPEVAEIVVVDDASSDDTPAAARACDDGSGRLKVLTQSKNAGPSAARNRAIAESSAPWLAVLDADDFFLPGRMRGLLSFADGADMVADNMWQVAEQDVNGPRRSLLSPAPSQSRAVGFSEFVRSNVSRPGRQRAELGFIKPLMRRAFLDAHNIRYQEHMRLGEDFELYARALALGARLLLVPAQGYVSVVRENSLSGRHSETDLKHLRDCDEALLANLPLPQQDRAALRAHYLGMDCRYQWRMLILAVKARSPMAALRTFLRPWPVPLYLARQLAQQAWLRGVKRHLA